MLYAIYRFSLRAVVLTLAGCLIGFVASVALMALWSLAFIFEPRSPGSDPLVAMGLLWGFMVGPLMTGVGGLVGFARCCMLSWQEG